MTDQKYKHYDSDDGFLSLHDCDAKKIEFRDGTLTFFFPDGFWVLPEHEASDLKQVVRTDEAQVDFLLEDQDESNATIYVFTQSPFGKVIREEWPVAKLLDAINRMGFRLEFLYQYKGYNERIFDCWLWFDKKPYHRECELRIAASQVIYCWNNLCEDQPW